MTRPIASACVLMVLSLSACVVAPGDLTTGSLIREMVDLRRLADFPQPGFKTVQFSSYDHRSTLPGGPHWFANSDGFGRDPVPNFERVLREPGEDGIGEYLICDVQGPGAIVRTWTAAIVGDIRLYLDGAEQPIYDGSADQFMRYPYRTFAQAAGIEEAVLDGTFYQRNAAYCPIPFAKRCRMVWIGKVKEIHFYHVQVRLYDSGANVITFAPQDLKTYRADLQDVARVMANPNGQWKYTSTEDAVAISATIAAGQTQEILALEGPRALERLTLRAYAGDLDHALRQTVLRVVCDEYPAGHVQAPLGDFFGAAPGINPFDAVPLSVAPDGTMTCRYVMPFAKSLKILLENHGAQPVTVTGSALPVDYSWNDETSMHFRARWRVDHGVIADPRAVQDMPYLLANGGGVYVGTATMLLNPTPVPTPGGGWWGEGDEKIFVDGDIRPSTFGTGSEDYYNYAWSVPDIFVHPYCGQPRNDGPGNRGFVTNQRWHIVDCLPFRDRITFYMELKSHERTPGMSYARIAYYYARPGTIDDHVAITDEDVRPLSLAADWQPAPRGAVRNSIFYQAEELLQKDGEPGLESGNLWAGSRLLVWRPAEKGDQLAFRVPILQDGKHALHLGMRLNREAGVVSARLDGRAIGFGGEAGVIDLHRPYRTLARQFSSKTIELAKGEHELTIAYEGPSEAGGGTAIGIDYLCVQQRK